MKTLRTLVIDFARDHALADQLTDILKSGREISFALSRQNAPHVYLSC